MEHIKQYMDEIRNEQLKQTQQQMPSLVQMGKNIVQTVVDTAKSAIVGEGVSLTEEQANSRLKICESCEFYQQSRCTKCGCYMAVKTHLKAASCPVGKW